MTRRPWRLTGLVWLGLVAGMLSACEGATGQAPTGAAKPEVLAAETFLADIVANVAGDRMAVDALLPMGTDPHEFEPSPSDVRRVAESDVLVINGAGLEGFLAQLMANADGRTRIVEASSGLVSRPVQGATGEAGAPATDPHFWLDPVLATTYVANIRDALAEADPAGSQVYARNAAAYDERLRAIDTEIAALVAQLPSGRRLLVTNHGSLGYFADRYGFTVVGTVLPGVSSDASPSARDLADLVDRIRAAGVPAVFIEVGANRQLAEQVAREAGVPLVSGIYTESLTPADGPAPTYIDLLRHDAQTIVDALR